METTPGIGHNSRLFSDDDEPPPPKAQRIISLERAKQIEIATTLLAARFRTAAWRIRGKRKTGEAGREGRALRRYVVIYARSLGSPIWEVAEILKINKKQVGQEIVSYLEMLADNPHMEANADALTDMLDAALRVDCGLFLRASLAAIEAEAAAKRAIRRAKAAADLLEQNAPKPKPKSQLSEAELLVAAGIARDRADKRAQAERILRAVAARGAPDDAAKARKALAELNAAPD